MRKTVSILLVILTSLNAGNIKPRKAQMQGGGDFIMTTDVEHLKQQHISGLGADNGVYSHFPAQNSSGYIPPIIDERVKTIYQTYEKTGIIKKERQVQRSVNEPITSRDLERYQETVHDTETRTRQTQTSSRYTHRLTGSSSLRGDRNQVRLDNLWGKGAEGRFHVVLRDSGADAKIQVPWTGGWNRLTNDYFDDNAMRTYQINVSSSWDGTLFGGRRHYVIDIIHTAYEWATETYTVDTYTDVWRERWVNNTVDNWVDRWFTETYYEDVYGWVDS